MINKDNIKGIVSSGSIVWRKHALQRIMERQIVRADVKKAITEGAVIETYTSDTPFPSLLISHVNYGSPLHVVVAVDQENSICYIITAYVPDEKYFESDFMTRRK